MTVASFAAWLTWLRSLLARSRPSDQPAIDPDAAEAADEAERKAIKQVIDEQLDRSWTYAHPLL